MAHGLGGVREAGLEPFAERFAAAGLEVIVFDYASFGASTGEPRQVIDVDRQLADWRAAIAHARSLDSVDPSRVAAWGTSFGGGHALTIAAEDGELAAAVAQVPMADGVAALRVFSPARALRSTWAGLRDEAARLRGKAARIACPLLVCVCDRDGITPPEPAVESARLAPLGEARHYDARHFDIYVGEVFEQAVADQVEFLTRILRP